MDRMFKIISLFIFCNLAFARTQVPFAYVKKSLPKFYYTCSTLKLCTGDCQTCIYHADFSSVSVFPNYYWNGVSCTTNSGTNPTSYPRRLECNSAISGGSNYDPSGTRYTQAGCTGSVLYRWIKYDSDISNAGCIDL